MGKQRFRVWLLPILLVLVFASCQVSSIFMPEVLSPSLSIAARSLSIAGSPTWVGSVPAGTGITSATVWIYADLVYAESYPVTVYLHRVTAPWEEDTVTWDGFGGAHDVAEVSSVKVNATGWYQMDITALVQGWSDGEYPNYGFLLRQPEDFYTRYLSSDSDPLETRPLIEVQFAGQTASYRRGEYGDVADAYVWQGLTSNTGTNGYLYTGFVSDREKQSLIQFDITFEEQEGYTRTIGYWKNHAGLGGGNQADMVTPLLPVWLGDPGGDKSFEVVTAESAVAILSRTDGGGRNGIAKYRSQLLAAKLNIAAGASNTAVASVIIDADAFLSSHDLTDWDSLPRATKREVIEWMSMLDDYNNGVIGPGHADD